jgi:hypothetical protein
MRQMHEFACLGRPLLIAARATGLIRSDSAHFVFLQIKVIPASMRALATSF